MINIKAPAYCKAGAFCMRINANSCRRKVCVGAADALPAGERKVRPLAGADNAARSAARRRVADGLAKNAMSFGTQNSPRQAPAFSHSVQLSFFVTDFGLSKLTFLLLMVSCKNSPFLMCQSIGRRI